MGQDSIRTNIDRASMQYKIIAYKEHQYIQKCHKTAASKIPKLLLRDKPGKWPVKKMKKAMGFPCECIH